jgi:hypothetical protein
MALILELFINEIFLFLKISYQVLSLWSFFIVTISRDSMFFGFEEGEPLGLYMRLEDAILLHLGLN